MQAESEKKGGFAGRIFEADLGGFNIVETTRSLW